MTDSGSHRRPEPERPELAIKPLRAPTVESGPHAADRVSLWAWVAVAMVIAALAAVVAAQYNAVHAALEGLLGRTDQDATAADIAETATVTLLGSGVVALILLLVAALALSMASKKRTACGVVLTVTGVATVGASILFRSFMTDAGSIAAGALQWGPLVTAGVAAVATVASGLTLVRR